MKPLCSLVLLCLGFAVDARCAPKLANIRAELKSLSNIGGAGTGFHGVFPGRFYLLYPYCVIYGDEKTFTDFLNDENPIVATMGALCLLDMYPKRREEVLAKMKADTRSVDW